MACKAGMSTTDYFAATFNQIRLRMIAVDERAHEHMTRLAYRAAVYQRADSKRFPKSETDLFRKRKKKPQSVADQLATAKLITKMMKA